MPDIFESSTANAVGLVGLAAGVRWVMDRGVTVRFGLGALNTIEEVDMALRVVREITGGRL